MALQGTLDSFSLPDVLRLLASTQKSGRLHIEGDRGEGSIWIDSGAIVGASADRSLDDAPVDEVVFEMLRFGEGAFVFHTDEQPDRPEAPTDVDKALGHASELLEEWRELETVVPSLEHRVAIAPELTVDQVTVDAARWKTLVALAPGIAVGDLGSTLNQGELAVSRTVNDLVELGVAVVEPPQEGAGRRSSTAGGSSRRRSSERTRAKPDSGRRQVPPRRERSDADEDNGGDQGARAGWRHDDTGGGRVAGGRSSQQLSDADGSESEQTAPFPAPSNGANGTNMVDERDELPRRSRATGQRSAPRRANGNVAPPQATAQPSRGFTNGTPVAAAAAPAPAPTSTSGAGLAGLPTFDNNDSPVSGVDPGPLGPSPLPGDNGQDAAMVPSSLPPDLNWAADDDEGPVRLPPSLATSPGSGPMGATAPPPAASQQQRPPQLADGEEAAHVAVLSPGARAAVENTIGASGGGPGLAAGANPDENMQRGSLLGFMASVRR